MALKSWMPYVAAALFWLTTSASAEILSGMLNDPTNTALVGSDLGAPSFTDEYAIANNVALYSLDVTTPGVVTITSTGFAGGGVDPYFSIFSGAGNTATFLDSNYMQAFFLTGGDFSYSGSLAAGTYQIALGAFANMSFAENYGSGTLGDGFIGLVSPDSLGNPQSPGYASYSLTVTTPVPEPAAATLMALGLSVALVGSFRRKAPARARTFNRTRTCAA